jgi:hypothetical protein
MSAAQYRLRLMQVLAADTAMSAMTGEALR